MKDPTTHAPASLLTNTGSASRSGRRRRSSDRRRDRELPSGSRLGRYVVLYRLGRGGMGVVYAAYDPQLDRKVAVKVLRPNRKPQDGEDDRMLLEAQALARLAHPNVVAVHDAGLIDGQVFVAMDFVEGDTLRRWLKAAPRSRREILDAFRQAGEALVAAHSAEIVHRDFKPDNAIIGREGRVQVLDFGLARLRSDTPANDSMSGRRLSTERSGGYSREDYRRKGTPAYMAPEQHDHEDVGPAADQFSFCVSLWEALCGRPPFFGRNEVLLTNIVTGNFSDSGRKLSGHLRKILRRGLAVDPGDRYPSMRALLTDLDRDPRRRWRRVGLGVGALVIAGGGAAAYAQLAAPSDPCTAGTERMAEVWNDETRAQVDTAIANSNRGHSSHTQQAIGQAVDDYSQRWVSTYTEACEATHVRHEQSDALLDLRMNCLSQRLEDLSAVTTLLADADGEVADRALSTIDGLSVIEGCNDVLALRERQPLPRDEERRREVERTRGRVAQSRALERAGRLDEAVVGARAALRRARELDYEPLVAKAGLALGTALEAKGDIDEASQVLLDAELAAEVARDDAVLMEIRVLLVMVEGDRQARTHSGHIWARLARATLERIGGDPGFEALLENNVALVLEHEARPEDVLAHQRRAIELAEQAGLSELRRASLYNNLAGTLAQVGRFDEALQRAQQARLTWERSLGSQHHRVATAMAMLGYIYDLREDTRQALHWYQRGYDQIVRELGADNPRTAELLANLAISQAQRGQLEEAEGSFRRVLALNTKAFGPDHFQVARAHVNLGVLLSRRGYYEDALAEQRRALAIKERTLDDDNPQLAASLHEVANALEKLERHHEALPLRERGLDILEQAYGRGHARLATVLANLAYNYLEVDDLGHALSVASRGLVVADDPSVGPVERAYIQLVLASVLSARDEDLDRVRELFDLAQRSLTDHEAPTQRQLLSLLAERHGWEVEASPPPSATAG
ncbi:MAG: serine/threonine-protein kinase [Myxococcota bacterium]